MTMTLVSTVTVGAGGAASIEWTGIPQTGTDLLVVISAKSTTAAGEGANTLYVRLNGATTGYTRRYLQGNGASVSSASMTSALEIGYLSGSTSVGWINAQMIIPNYTGSTAKSITADLVSENNASTAYQTLTAASYSGTSAITSLSLNIEAGSNYAQYSTASLYLVTKGSGGATAS